MDAQSQEKEVQSLLSNPWFWLLVTPTGALLALWAAYDISQSAWWWRRKRRRGNRLQMDTERLLRQRNRGR